MCILKDSIVILKDKEEFLNVVELEEFLKDYIAELVAFKIKFPNHVYNSKTNKIGVKFNPIKHECAVETGNKEKPLGCNLVKYCPPAVRVSCTDWTPV